MCQCKYFDKDVFNLVNASFSGGPNSSVLAAGLCLRASVKDSSTSAACGINFM